MLTAWAIRVREVNVFDQPLRFAVLGPVRAWRNEDELDMGSPQQQVVLAALLMAGGRALTLGELIDSVWGHDPPATAVNVIRTYASRLRKVLEPGTATHGPPRVLVSVGNGYALHVRKGALDAAEFERKVAQAVRLRREGHTADAADLLHEALRHTQPVALVGLPGPFAEAERARLGEQRLAALEARIEADLELGRHRDVTTELISLIHAHPLREQLCRMLMLALYRSGRPAEALDAYRRTRRVLVDMLGIEPGAHLQDLHARILAADPSLDLQSPERTAPRTHSPEPGTPSAVRPAQLPSDLPDFVGRSSELDRVRALLPADGRAPSTVIITAIGGMAGIGKTTLAVHWAHEVAHRFPDGQLCVNLRGFDPADTAVAPGEAVRMFLDALGVPAAQIPAGFDAQVALYRSKLVGRRMLILLDNARDTDQVRPLLPGSPGSLVVVTSRNRLTGLVAREGARPLTLDQLSHEEAYELLARRIGDGRPAAEPDAVEEIIARCARLPLALAVVAAHAAEHPGFPLRAVADALRESQDSLDAFEAGDALTTDLRAVFSWSYHALSAPAARLFRLLSLHCGSDVSAPAAAALTGLPLRENRTLLRELTRAHMLTEHSPDRYVLHDLLRVYAAECVHADESEQEIDRAQARMLAWYLYTADSTCAHITPARRRVPLDPPPDDCHPLVFQTYDQALEWCETERGNLVAVVHRAVALGDLGTAWRLPAALWGFFYLRNHFRDWLEVTGTGLSAARADGDLRGQAQSLLDRAAALRLSKRYDETIHHLRQALVVWRELGDRPGWARTVNNLGDAYLQAGQTKKAIEYFRRGLTLVRIVGTVWGEGISLTNLGDAYQRLGRYEEAVDCLEKALTVLRANGNRWVEGVALDILGAVRHRLGDPGTAVGLLERAAAVHRDVGNQHGELHTLFRLGDLHLAEGRPDAARVCWDAATAVLRSFDTSPGDELRRLGRAPDGSPAEMPEEEHLWAS